MPILEVKNTTFRHISTTIGLLKPIVQGGKPIRVQYDVVPRSIIDELETFRSKNWVDFSILEDPDISNDIEPSTATPLIGEPTSGSLPSGVDSDLSIADAIQAIGVGSNVEVGEPTSGDYSNVIPTIDETTKISDAFQIFGEFNSLLAPDQPGSLSGQDLTIIGTTSYSAKIPAGLSSNWDPLNVGQTITNLLVDGIFTLESPNQADRFIAGFAGDLSTAGSLDLIEDGSVVESYDIAANDVGTIGRITISDISTYNSVWQKANANFSINLSSEGRHRFSMQHSEAGTTNEEEFYFDDVNTAPSFSSDMAVSVNTVISKYLSGIEALGSGSTIDIAYTAASGIFEKTYHPTEVGQVSGPGHNTSSDNPVSDPNFNDAFSVNRTLTLDAANQSHIMPAYTAIIQKPDGQNDSSADLLGQPVNTYGVVSTGKDEQFFDEDRRIVLNSGTTSGTASAFDSTVPLIDGNAQQLHDGSLRYPDTTDYPDFSGDQEYQRFIDKTGASVGAITFVGLNFDDVDPYGTGDLNILLELAVEGKFFDLGRSIGNDNGDGSGDSRANSIGARNDGSSSGTLLSWSTGVDSTAFNNDEYRLIIIFRNNTHFIARITEV